MKYRKHFTIDERRRVTAESCAWRAAERAKLPRGEVDLIMMKQLLGEGSRHGGWNDLWSKRPHPTMNEPHKAMSCLTPNDRSDQDTKGRKHPTAGYSLARNKTGCKGCPIATAGLPAPASHSHGPSDQQSTPALQHAIAYPSRRQSQHIDQQGQHGPCGANGVL